MHEFSGSFGSASVAFEHTTEETMDVLNTRMHGTHQHRSECVVNSRDRFGGHQQECPRTNYRTDG